MANKYTINLLQAELLTVKPFMTLKNVVLLWLVTAIVMGAITFFINVNHNQLVNEHKQLEQLSQQYNNELADIEKRLEAHKPDTALTAELDSLLSLIANKQHLHQQLTDTDTSYIGGFAHAMGEIASLHNPNISLEHIHISEQNISFSGVARSADAVPNWLTNFDRSAVLSGKLFEQFKLTENDQKLISFTVSSNGKSIGEPNQ